MDYVRAAFPSLKHIVYAVTQIGSTHYRYQVSEPLPWDEAQDRWLLLDDIRRLNDVEMRVGGVQPRFFAVRAENDPEWGAHSTPAHVLIRHPEQGYQVW